MKTTSEIKPNFGPVYAAAMYPDLCSIFQRHGYALAAHGSLARDFDLVAVPWAEKLSPPQKVLEEATSTFAISLSPDSPHEKLHGRKAYTLICGFGDCQIDLSFLESSENYKRRLEDLKQDGNWFSDRFGECKLCGGEIPHGHSRNCDILKYEMKIRELENELKDALDRIEGGD